MPAERHEFGSDSRAHAIETQQRDDAADTAPQFQAEGTDHVRCVGGAVDT